MNTNTLRLPYKMLSPDAYQGFLTTKKALEKSSLGNQLIELLNLRISQINGCAYCLEMHATLLRADGVSEAKLDSLAGWRVSHHFSDREQAALAWAESLADVADTHAPDDAFEPLKRHFSDQEISDLCFVISLMSAFNRLAIGLRQ
ncbi:carboxymuconolactone decarboxylase family protein [Prodigiosinella confusarubida]|uniref:Carboxymuconolactone decarboxylase family protein n=1 Tax=Serratia sp. (strain ATCC 39006) TaxID=104623 RepID=A0A2I5TB33_SERS3|nr:carboxymuconolactone decarboxylase family protein [Serratia sp. ATCC 39006]AUH01742.1 carboxymuconolactone decarboxylase family protein [Serratia sp. ATCC 39006]AUH06065.1 carboxymuconolactone decarboxylase family protein [Serratia sp. ATCC 39006]